MRPQQSSIRLRWVMAEPGGERAVDALGTGAQADLIADALLPHLSGSTSRARYFSFLCWAVAKSEKHSAPRTAIHRQEALLAFREVRRHGSSVVRDCPNIVGRLNVAHYLEHNQETPTHPERLFKSTAFATYGPAMRRMGLLTNRARPELTEEGRKLGRAYASSRTHCLSELSSAERSLIRASLGLDARRRATSAAAATRLATYDEVRLSLVAGDAFSVLNKHAQLATRSNDVSRALHRAFTWELLSCGLRLAFGVLVEAQLVSLACKQLRTALRSTQRRPALGTTFPVDVAAAGHVVSQLRAAMSRRPEELSLNPEAIHIARLLCDKGDCDGFLHAVIRRHHAAKSDGPWVALNGDRVQPLVPQKLLKLGVTPRSYRLDAFRQLLVDLGER